MLGLWAGPAEGVGKGGLQSSCVCDSVVAAFRRGLLSVKQSVLSGMRSEVVVKYENYPKHVFSFWVDAGHRHGVP